MLLQVFIVIVVVVVAFVVVLVVVVAFVAVVVVLGRVPVVAFVAVVIHAPLAPSQVCGTDGLKSEPPAGIAPSR